MALTLHPRPNAIAAALYTLRDLNIDLIVVHGPPGCCFKHARLLDEDGVKVVTTGMGEDKFIFGGHDALVETIYKAIKMFNPKNMAIVGTCASMIVGEDIDGAVEDAGIDIPVLTVDIHGGYEENTAGVIAALKSAVSSGIITEEEFKRQEYLMREATKLEENFGAAYKAYIEPSQGDSKYLVGKRLLELIDEGKHGACILNSKKETTYIFADIMRAVNEVSHDIKPINIANLSSNLGLSKIRNDAKIIKRDLEKSGVKIDYITGGLDEYAITGKKAAEIVKKLNVDFLVIAGVPHAVPLKNMDYEIFSITNGLRQVEPLKKILKHQYVIVEVDLHPKTMGVRSIINSEFGNILRDMHNDRRS
ncbi:Ni-sirohydrochlorin a,c-diamide reductive cyclase catalytic subunit [Candidatus Methanoliparum sp. LAM-1]|nr:Ni-sirohydrochlorin a,c-diamide reductive cyclase catalytic subunit [Candidatus Methanoliparum sp. LAM-1]BDC35703.1 Ni-sirohydrochlorin a,c-diamide reductive cyclase catalytic subunit [Candidatus Methanoliparum sp. LAM-1]